MFSTFTERINFVQKHLGKGLISRDGNDITVSCPNCKDASKKKLAINLETWKYHCWVCGSKGNTIISLLRKHGSRDAIESFRSSYLNDKVLFFADEKESKFELPERFIPIPALDNTKNPNTKAVLRYLDKRGVTQQDIWRFRIGVSDSDKFSRRAIFASLDATGEPNYYVSRSVDQNSRFRYLNATTDKTSIVFNDIDVDWDKPVYIVEGVFDLIAIKENGTCLLGSSLTENSLLFKKIVANESDVVLCLDNDMIKKTGKIADLLTSYGCNVSIMDTSSAKDIAEMSEQQLNDAKSSIARWNMAASFRYKISNIKSGSLI